MTTHFAQIAQAAAADGKVSADEVLALRRQGWGDGIIVREAAEAIFALNNALEERSDEWCDFFVEAICEFVLNGTEPKRMCDEGEARWLIDQIDHDGVVDSLAELEAIVRVVEKAENVPDALKQYVVAQIEKEVLSGTGPTRCGGELSDTHISSAEVRILRRVVFASGGYGPAAVSRFEAEMLFRLKDATLAEANAPEWDELCLDGVSNYLKGFAHQNAQLDHGRAKELEAFMNNNESSVGRFIGRVVKEVPQAGNHFGKVFGKKQRTGPTFEAQAQAGEAITDFEQEWLDKMIKNDGQTDDLERRLLARIIEDGE